ncbi:iron-containing redox enzyme family protein [Marinobacter daepoensis]|uniref:Iron-containing redox enzyme family protein n=1 Tax=Marinobacter daepoensis TaxID=262077 RepID=A0ABS3BE75_9GAMM|nr:iron-containing redox enzyme family protein [Marinobacter daepoensis]MBN7770133.1 iron-containing redox enzyme family protein [Marinobacter daepoensis]MBY6079579.1 iron-containing redox enzyme family protein [Marinobacter daepoensis]
MEDTTIIDQLDHIIQENKYSKHPFVADVVRGKADKDGLRAWAIQKYFQVYYQVQGFSAIHSSCEKEDVRQFMAEQIEEEETGGHEATDSHYNLMKRFAKALGAQDSDFEVAEVGEAVKSHFSRLMSICKEEHFVYGLLAFYVFESQTSESAMKMFSGFKQHLGMSDEDLEWFTVHGEADIEHSKMHRDFLFKYCKDVPGFEQRAIELVEEGCANWNSLQDFYYSLIDREHA